MKLIEVIPNVADYWSGENIIDFHTIEAIDDRMFIYQCQKCKQNSERRVKAFCKKPNSCGVCAGKIVVPGYNDALTAFPNIINYWDYDKNVKNPEEYTKQSALKVWSKCNKCRQSTLRKVHDIVNFSHSCSVCSGKTVVGGFNDLKTKFPDLALEWNYEKNEKLPEETYPFGRGSAWWRCLKNGHEWFCTISSRTSMGNNCPYCSNQRTLQGWNDMTTVLPELLKYWDYEKNVIKPTEVTVNSSKIAYWRCSKGHEWEGRISGRSKTYIGENGEVKFHIFDCNRCSRSERVSKKEKELLEFCQSLNIKAEGSYTLIKGMEYDIYFPDHSLAVEFNGDYWHSEKVMKDKYNVSALEWHENRKKKSLDKNVKLFYVWESDWNCNRVIVERAVKDLLFNNVESEILLKNGSEV